MEKLEIYENNRKKKVISYYEFNEYAKDLYERQTMTGKKYVFCMCSRDDSYPIPMTIIKKNTEDGVPRYHLRTHSNDDLRRHGKFCRYGKCQKYLPAVDISDDGEENFSVDFNKTRKELSNRNKNIHPEYSKDYGYIYNSGAEIIRKTMSFADFITYQNHLYFDIWQKKGRDYDFWNFMKYFAGTSSEKGFIKHSIVNDKPFVNLDEGDFIYLPVFSATKDYKKSSYRIVVGKKPDGSERVRYLPKEVYFKAIDNFEREYNTKFYDAVMDKDCFVIMTGFIDKGLVWTFKHVTFLIASREGLICRSLSDARMANTIINVIKRLPVRKYYYSKSIMPQGYFQKAPSLVADGSINIKNFYEGNTVVIDVYDNPSQSEEEQQKRISLCKYPYISWETNSVDARVPDSIIADIRENMMSL